MTVVRIICKQLSSFLHGTQIGLPPNCRKRRREAIPLEALSLRKEAKFANCEAEEAVKSEAKDPV